MSLSPLSTSIAGSGKAFYPVAERVCGCALSGVRSRTSGHGVRESSIPPEAESFSALGYSKDRYFPSCPSYVSATKFLCDILVFNYIRQMNGVNWRDIM